MKIINEAGVEYLFSKYHELLGFEEILIFDKTFPDIIAMKNGVEVRIELEFKLINLKIHYLVDIFYRGEYVEIKSKENKIIIKNVLREEEIDNKNNNLYVKEYHWGWELRKHSLSYDLDYVVCYKRNTDWDADGIQIIELKTELPKLGIKNIPG